MLTAIRQWVVQTMMKGQTGVVRTLPKNDLIELNTQITAERMLRNGINPDDMKTVGQVENVVKQIDTPKVNVNPGVTGVKKADVLDMEGNKIDTSKGIMGGKEIDLDKTNRTVDDLGGDKTDPFSKNFDFENEVKLQTELALKKESDAAIKARIEADNEKNIASMKKKLEDPEEKADGGRIGLLAGSVPKVFRLLKNKKRVQQAVDDIFPTGDYKYDAQMAADALVENNPKTFGGKLYEDLDQDTQMEIYSTVLEPITNRMATQMKLQRATKPEKTLQSMKEGKGIDMSDPGISEEFTRFMKETDPEGYKKLEQTVELSNFKTKGRKENSDGGRIGLFMGGANTAGKSVLREMLNYFGKKSDSVKNPSDILRIVNPKRLNELLENPEIYRKFDIEKGIAAPDLIKNMQKQMNVDRKKTIQEMLSSAKNIKSADDNTIKYKNEMIEDMIKKGVDRKMAEEMAGTISKMAENAAGKTNTPKLTDEGILQLENILKNMETGGKKARDLNADGGRIGLKAGMTKRNFLKLMGSVGAGIGAVKSGIFSGLGKGAGKTVAKEVAQQTTSSMPPAYFFKLAEKIKNSGDDVTKRFATKDREVVTNYQSKNGDFEMYEDLDTGDVRIKITKGDPDAPGYNQQELTLTKGQADETTKKAPPDEYDEYTVKSDFDGKMKDIEDGLDDIEDIIDEIGVENITVKDLEKAGYIPERLPYEVRKKLGIKDAPSIKYASGGLAYMLGE